MLSIQETPIDTTALTQELESRSSGHGATVTFTGTMRELSTNHKQLKALYLEHYPNMTDKALSEVLEEVTSRFELGETTLVHRIGTILPNEAIVYIGITSSHRRAAFDACQMIMDYLKNLAPFWKKEIFVDGTEQWVEQKITDVSAMEKWRAKS